MVDQEGVSLIVMLTHTKEDTKVKCHQYWPTQIQENESQHGIVFDRNKEVNLISHEKVMPNLIKRKMQLSFTDSKGKSTKTRIVTHLQYLTWPDHGAPEEQDYKIIKSIIEHVREHHPGSVDEEGRVQSIENGNKIVLHCSAGIGRTGSLIAIYNLQ